MTANRPFREAAAEIVAAIASILDGATMPALRIDDDSAAELSWLLSALLPVCDWVGSNQNWFPANVSCHDARTYWEHVAKPQAAKALSEAGLSRAEFAAPAPSRTLGHLPGAVLTPLQDTAFTFPLSALEPTLILIEDATGSGKTEAALTLAHRLMAQGSASGFYFALPTMATANAMYARLTETYRALFDDAERDQPSLALAHGKALRNEGFLRSLAREPARNGRGEPDTGAFCSGWIADSRRKALLAQAGAGTIDQALMAVLPLRYQSIRLHGLIGKVLTLDEIHSFDSFMLKLIETLLELHSRLGGSAIVMSATLPTAIRARLLRTFAKGRGLVSPAACSGAYPLVTTLSGDW